MSEAQPETVAGMMQTVAGRALYETLVAAGLGGPHTEMSVAAIEAEARAAGAARYEEAIDAEIKRLWKVAYAYDQHGAGTIGLLVDMTNAIGGLDSLRSTLLAAAPLAEQGDGLDEHRLREAIALATGASNPGRRWAFGTSQQSIDDATNDIAAAYARLTPSRPAEEG